MQHPRELAVRAEYGLVLDVALVAVEHDVVAPSCVRAGDRACDLARIELLRFAGARERVAFLHERALNCRRVTADRRRDLPSTPEVGGEGAAGEGQQAASDQDAMHGFSLSTRSHKD